MITTMDVGEWAVEWNTKERYAKLREEREKRLNDLEDQHSFAFPFSILIYRIPEPGDPRNIKILLMGQTAVGKLNVLLG